MNGSKDLGEQRNINGEDFLKTWQKTIPDSRPKLGDISGCYSKVTEIPQKKMAMAVVCLT